MAKIAYWLSSRSSAPAALSRLHSLPKTTLKFAAGLFACVILIYLSQPADEPNKELDVGNEGKIQPAVFIKQEPTYSIKQELELDMYESDEDAYSIKRSKLSKMKTGSKRKF